jgi:hypothetical protein
MQMDWDVVGSEVEREVSSLVGSAWQNASAGASTQFASLLAAGKLIEQNRESMSAEDYEDLKLMQQRALEGVLQTYAGISLDVAQQAAAAAWGVLASALKAAYPMLTFL